MFAYCGNNSVNYIDPNGNYYHTYHDGGSVFDTMNGIVDAGGGGGQVGPPGWNPGVDIPKLKPGDFAEGVLNACEAIGEIYAESIYVQTEAQYQENLAVYTLIQDRYSTQQKSANTNILIGSTALAIYSAHGVHVAASTAIAAGTSVASAVAWPVVGLIGSIYLLIGACNTILAEGE